MKNDPLGDRMKKYENVWRQYLIPRMPIIVRIDGKAFHGYVKKCKFEYPFDNNLIKAVDDTMISLLNSTQGAILGYSQSDEISLLLQTDKELTTEALFAGNIQKIVSCLASEATVVFNTQPTIKTLQQYARFDARVFNLTWDEVPNYFLWRYKDCYRNSISGYARNVLSHKECQNKSSEELLTIIFNKSNGIKDWHELPSRYKYGLLCVKDICITTTSTKLSWEYLNNTVKAIKHDC